MKYIAECIGTYFLVSVVIGSGIMAENLSNGNVAVALLGNTLATGAILFVLIKMFAQISGAHFNPAVSLVLYLKREITLQHCVYFILFQFAGGFLGVVLANTMFGLDVIQIAQTGRGGLHIYLGEFIATFGLLITILGVRKLSLIALAPAVGLYIASAIWFTSSTSFANPAVTFARGFSDTFTGIHPEFIFVYIALQIAGAVMAMLFMNFLQNE